MYSCGFLLCWHTAQIFNLKDNMTPLLALEEFDPMSVIAADAPAFDEEINDVDGQRYIEGIQETAQHAARVQALGHALEAHTPSPGRTASERALNRAVQGFLEMALKDGSEVRMVAFEDHLGYPTQMLGKQIAQENLTAIKDAFVRLLKRIVAFLGKIVQWFKNIFDRQGRRSKRLQDRVNAVRERVRQGPQRQVADGENSFVDERIYRHLAIGTSELTPLMVVSNAKQHYDHLQRIDADFLRMERAYLNSLNSIFTSLSSASDHAEAEIAKAYSLLFSCNSANMKKRSAADPSDNNLFWYEEELDFGNASFFRTGAQDTAVEKVRHEIVDARVDKNSAFKAGSDDYLKRPLVALSEKQFVVLHTVITAHIQHRNSHKNQEASALNSLNTISYGCENFLRIANPTEQQKHRAHHLLKLVSSYVKLKSVQQNALHSYDDMTTGALISYMERSAAFTF